MTRDGTEQASLRIVRPAGTLRGQVVDTLRSAIVEGRFRSGERLVERRVCELLGVSRTLVREALRQLEAEGLVENAPYRGPSVATVTAEQVQQIYEMRGALEGLAARLFVLRASDEEVAALAESVEAVAECYRQDDDTGQRAAVERFYDLLLRGARNDMLTSAVALHRARLTWLRAISLSRRERRGTSLEEKQGIVRAIAARDAAKARALAEEHVEHALAGVLEVLAAEQAGEEQRRATG
ncbi:MAG: GntR family transcriptional regulator [Reyranellaceae bacterium]